MSTSSKTFLIFIVLQVKNLASSVCCPESLYYSMLIAVILSFDSTGPTMQAYHKPHLYFQKNTIQLQTCFLKKKNQTMKNK